MESVDEEHFIEINNEEIKRDNAMSIVPEEDESNCNSPRGLVKISVFTKNVKKTSNAASDLDNTGANTTVSNNKSRVHKSEGKGRS